MTGGTVSLDSSVSTKQLAEYLATVYFGPASDRFYRYVQRAYRDLSRTLHTADVATRDERLLACRAYLIARLDAAAEHSVVADWSSKTHAQQAFDDWHVESCTALMSQFGAEMTYGHAQKWVNMALKYAFTAHGLGVTDIGHIALLYPYAHVPLDRVVMSGLIEQDPTFPLLPCVWSKLRREEYFRIQDAIRERYSDCPMDVEFKLWRSNAAPPILRDRRSSAHPRTSEEKSMRVEYDEASREFRIYRDECDSDYTTMPYQGQVQSYRALDADTFKVVGQFGDVSVFNAYGKLV